MSGTTYCHLPCGISFRRAQTLWKMLLRRLSVVFSVCPEPPVLHCCPVAELEERTGSCRVCSLVLNTVNEWLSLHWWKSECRFLVKVASDFKMKLFHFDFWCFQMTSPTPKPTTVFRESCSCYFYMDVMEWKRNPTGGNKASRKEK